MKTNPIYMLEPYKKTMTAKVLEVSSENNEKRIIFDQTVFYPMGGGQSTDQGTLKLANGNSVEVYQVMIKDGEIWHYIKTEEEINVGDEVTGEINWDRRYKNMKLHSGGHVVDFSMYLLGYSPKQLTPLKADHGKKPFIVYQGTLGKDIKQELEDKANELIKKEMKFSWQFESLDELKKEALYLQPNLPTNKPMRVLRLEGVGAVADGGTIVANTSEVGGIKIEKIEENEGNTTVYYSIIEDQKLEAGSLKPISSSQQAADSGQLDLNKYNINQQEILNTVSNDILNAKSEDELTNIWRKYLGKEGVITNKMKDISKVATEDKKAFGLALNDLKNNIDQQIEGKKLQAASYKQQAYLSVQQAELNTEKPKIGHIHPLTQTINDLNNIFRSLGYSIMDGPEIETDEYCFQRRNVPLDHPARDLQDTIYIEEPNILLRTQTSSIEARAMEKIAPPYKIVMPGRVYRNEKVNRSNHFTFHQYQLSCVQEKVSMAELLSTIEYLFKSYLGEDVVIRFRNKYYPEVEPGVGPDMRCFNCEGKGCTICKHRGWIEMGGAGIIHPKVLSMAGLDPKKWQGYAFGLGLDRWAMAKHKITDIRTLLGGNLAYRPNVG